jgi:hypothetical protein
VKSASGGRGRPGGVTALAIFFLAGALVACACAFALAFPGSLLEPMWRLNPSAREAFGSLGGWSVLLMTAVCVACAASGVELLRAQRRGYVLALGILAVNLAGDLVNGLWREPRALAGVPIAAAMLLYLRSARVRAFFAPGAALR